MKNYNKLPHKERKRYDEYTSRHTERKEELAIKRAMKEKQGTDSGFTSEKEREMMEEMQRFFESVGKDERE